MRSRRMTEAFLEGMAKVNALGAIAVISVRTQVGGEGNRVLAVAEVVDSARAQGNWWFAAGTEAAQWWLSRWETNVQVGSTSENGLVVDVRSGASYPLNGAWIELYLPGEPEDWTPRQNGTLVRHLRTEWGLQIPLGDLDQDSEARIVLESASQ